MSPPATARLRGRFRRSEGEAAPVPLAENWAAALRALRRDADVVNEDRRSPRPSPRGAPGEAPPCMRHLPAGIGGALQAVPACAASSPPIPTSLLTSRILPRSPGSICAFLSRLRWGLAHHGCNCLFAGCWIVGAHAGGHVGAHVAGHERSGERKRERPRVRTLMSAFRAGRRPPA